MRMNDHFVDKALEYLNEHIREDRSTIEILADITDRPNELSYLIKARQKHFLSLSQKE